MDFVVEISISMPNFRALFFYQTNNTHSQFKMLEIHVHNIFHFWAQDYSVNCACYYLFYYYSFRQEKERKYLSNLVQKFVKILQSIPELGKLL